MILATIALTRAVPSREIRLGTRGLAYDVQTLEVLGRLITFHTKGLRTLAQVDELGAWSSRSAGLANLLNQFFGPLTYDASVYYSPDGRSVEVARDVAHAFGGEMVGAVTSADEDEPDGVVF